MQYYRAILKNDAIIGRTIKKRCILSGDINKTMQYDRAILKNDAILQRILKNDAILQRIIKKRCNITAHH
jgi:hypothetical protein